MALLKVSVACFLFLLSLTEKSLITCSEQETLHDIQCLHGLLKENVRPEEYCQELKVDFTVPRRLVQLYMDSPLGLKIAVSSGKLEVAAPEDLSNVSSSLLHIIPSKKFSSMSGKQLAAIVKNNPTDISLLQKLAWLLKSPGKWTEFALEMQYVPLPYESQKIIAEAWFSMQKKCVFCFNETLNLGSPFLAFVPPSKLYSAEKNDLIQMLYFLKTWVSAPPAANRLADWSENPWHVKRTWFNISMRENFINSAGEWKNGKITSCGFLLEGALPEEISSLRSFTPNEKLARMNWNKLQARALFLAMLSNEQLASYNLAKVLPLVPKLSPTLLQKFDLKETDFRLTLSLPQSHEMSFVTGRQIVEFIIAHGISESVLENDNVASWNNHIEYIDQFVWALPTHKLLHYSSAPPSQKALQVIESYKISPSQAFILTGRGSFINFRKPESILALKGLLKGMSTMKIVKEKVESLPSRVATHILNHLPAGSTALSSAILQKVRGSLGDKSTVEHILTNPDPNQFFSLLSSSELMELAPKLISDLYELKGNREYSMKITRISRPVLSVLLEYRRRMLVDGIGWTVDSLLNTEASVGLLGLTCDDINMIELTDFIVIMEQYNRERIASGLNFPKDIQHCVLNVMFKYLRIKRTVQEQTEENLLDLLEPSEINAIGGYAFAGIHPGIICTTPNKVCILEAVGRLPMTELLVASGVTNPKIFAMMLINNMEINGGSTTIGLEKLLKLGNLFSFLDPSDINKIDPEAFKLFIESADDSISRVVCIDTASRNAWFNIIQGSFGKLHSWKPGTLATLGDFLAVIPSESLHEIPSHSWLEAADTLIDKTSYHHLVSTVDGRSEQLHYVCKDFLNGEVEQENYEKSVKHLVHMYILGIKKQLGTILSAEKLLSLSAYQSLSTDTGLHINTVPVLKPNTGMEVLEPTIEKKHKRENQVYGSILREILNQNPSSAQSTTTAAVTDDSATTVSYNEPSFKVTCLMVRAAGQSSQLVLSRSDLEAWSKSEVEDCLDVLATMELETDLQEVVWSLIRQHNIKVHFANLGNLLKAMEVEDVKLLNVSFENVWFFDTLTALNEHVTNPVLWNAISSKFQMENPLSSLKLHIATETVIAMASLLCYLPSKYIDTLASEPKVFLQAAPVIGRIPYCPPVKCMQKILNILTDSSLYGSPQTWTETDVRNLGILLTGLREGQQAQLISSRTNNPLNGLTADVARCMPSEFFKKLSPEQISSLPSTTVAAIPSNLVTQLSPEQARTFRERLTLELPDSMWRVTSSASHRYLSSGIFITLVSSLLVTFMFL